MCFGVRIGHNKEGEKQKAAAEKIEVVGRKFTAYNSSSQVALRSTQIFLRFAAENFWRAATRCAKFCCPKMRAKKMPHIVCGRIRNFIWRIASEGCYMIIDSRKAELGSIIFPIGGFL